MRQYLFTCARSPACPRATSSPSRCHTLTSHDVKPSVAETLRTKRRASQTAQALQVVKYAHCHTCRRPPSPSGDYRAKSTSPGNVLPARPGPHMAWQLWSNLRNAMLQWVVVETFQPKSRLLRRPHIRGMHGWLAYPDLHLPGSGHGSCRPVRTYHRARTRHRTASGG